ncbi:hypothetical protein [Thermomonas haemolytica]|uniref:hypothetical protein n=1 Tax=Thermomonas haemolytica TaxID=141949 RepID=UPI00104785FB|nr:hypothetical protein [Thermomonas haemolytica]
MSAKKIDLLRRAQQEVFRAQGRAIAILVLVLSLIAWWQQGFIRALICGIALYLFLMAIVVLSNRFERR